MTTTRTVQWVGEDDPARIDAASVLLEPDRLRAVGTSRSADYTTSWSLVTDTGWRTQRLEVTAYGFGWSRGLALLRDPDDGWRATTWAAGSADLPPAGIEDAASLVDAVDCDLGLCPVTNTMPMLRLGLPGDAEGGEHSLVMAWVEVPSLRVLRSDQRYAARAPVDPATGLGVVRYSSASRDFIADLTVDADGLVVDYPGLARRN
ncbi:putative glycolipid-binding domain-containing protein [Oerskovia flava]|uniref:putative glycolipid-binding domain-containing protein n=1 Tax=Oerskovia flava TaxID=2986422 RepID=UPI00223EBA19|nr:putative glycolipid-binding domain-containing protein [Oerskovia sp. JB1-3-2]